MQIQVLVKTTFKLSQFPPSLCPDPLFRHDSGKTPLEEEPDADPAVRWAGVKAVPKDRSLTVASVV